MFCISSFTSASSNLLYWIMWFLIHFFNLINLWSMYWNDSGLFYLFLELYSFKEEFLPKCEKSIFNFWNFEQIITFGRRLCFPTLHLQLNLLYEPSHWINAFFIFSKPNQVNAGSNFRFQVLRRIRCFCIVL